MSKVNLAIPLAALLAACNPSDKGGDSGGNPPITYPTTDTSGDTGPAEVIPVQVAAIGFEYVGGWNEETAELENYLYPDLSGTNGGYPLGLIPVVQVTLANTAYFDAGGPDNPNNYCAFLATFDGAPSASLHGTTFDWDAGDGGLGDTLETWGAFEGKLTILTDTYTDTCYGLDEAMWPGQTPTELMDGMHFGLGFGPESEYLYQQDYDNYGYAPPYAASIFTQYIAVNHPDGAGGFTFPAYDWNIAVYVATDYTTCLDYNTTAITDTAVTQLCGLVEVTEDQSQYILADTTIHPMHGYIQGNAYWFEDTPNLDLTILKEGVP